MLTRAQVSKLLGSYYSAKLSGYCWSGYDDSKRQYYTRGEDLPAHPDLAAQYPRGWSMLQWDKPSKARALIVLKEGAC